MSSTSGTRLRCPVCEEALDADATESDLASHVDGCLRAAPAQSPDETEIDVDGRDGFEEYEWAGQRRVRATSLVEGGLTDAHGFMTIERGDEDEELDVEGDGDEEKVGGAGQYGEQDVIMPGSSAIDNVEEEEEVSQTANSSIDELSKLRAENAALRAATPTCKVCMDRTEGRRVGEEGCGTVGGRGGRRATKQEEKGESRAPRTQGGTSGR